MEKQLVPALAVLVFCVLYTAAIAAQTKAHTTSRSAEKTRAEVQQHGFGKRVNVKLHSGMKVRGRITGLADDQFVVTDSKNGSMIKIAFSDVAEIRKHGEMPRVIRGAIIGIGITAAIVGAAGV